MFHARRCFFADIASRGDGDMLDDYGSEGDISDEEEGDDDDSDDRSADGDCFFFNSGFFPFFTRLFKSNF